MGMYDCLSSVGGRDISPIHPGTAFTRRDSRNHTDRHL